MESITTHRLALPPDADTAPLAPPPSDSTIGRALFVASLIAIGLAVALLLMLTVPTHAAPIAPVAAPTATLAIVRVTAAPPSLVAFWAPEGGVAGQVAIGGPVEVLAQYKGWAQFRTTHMAAPLWAPVAELARAVPVGQLAAAPELAPTAQPTTAPQIVYLPVPVAAPAEAAAPEPAALAPLYAPASSDLHSAAPTHSRPGARP